MSAPITAVFSASGTGAGARNATVRSPSAAGPAAGDPLFVGSAFLLSFAISMVAVIFPSGLGIREGAFALALAQNVPGGVAVALSVGVRLVLTLVELLFIAAVVIAGRRR